MLKKFVNVFLLSVGTHIYSIQNYIHLLHLVMTHELPIQTLGCKNATHTDPLAVVKFPQDRPAFYEPKTNTKITNSF